MAARTVEGQRTTMKARRTFRACDFCHRRGIRCRARAANDGTCQPCFDYGERCTNERPLKKRGPKQSRRGASVNTSSSRPVQSVQETDSSLLFPTVASQAVIVDLAEIFFEVVHPIFPFLDEDDFMRRIIRGEYQTDSKMFAVTMAMTALSSARVRDAAVFSLRWDLPALAKPPSEIFFSAAERALQRRDDARAVDLEFLQSTALLAITAIQYGERRLMYKYLSLYHGMIDADGAHDEANWPKDLSEQKVEERRRLFWSMYTLDVYASIVWGRMIRHREAQAYIRYPRSPRRSVSGETVSQNKHEEELQWMLGWNFTTDLYRLLEHAVDRCRNRRSRPEDGRHVIGTVSQSQLSTSDTLQRVLEMYESLPARLKTMPVANNAEQHRLNFQAANIIATLQLVKMVCFAAEDSTVSQRCNTARELLNAFANVPIIYLKALSSPLLHHLAGIGIILVFAIESELTESNYHEVRPLLDSLAGMVANLESQLWRTVGASSRIRHLISHLDECVQAGRLNFLQAMAAIPARQPNTLMSAGQLAGDGELDYSDNEAIDLSLKALLEDWACTFDFAAGFS